VIAWSALVVAAMTALGLSGCAAERGTSSASPALVRAERRAYDGAPPVVPHDDFGMTCASCHNEQGMEVEAVGFAPPSPHELTEGMNALSRCRQCHVFRQTDLTLVGNGFVGLRQDLRRGPRLNPLAPPTIPHKTFMRENCTACHAGAAAREEIRTPHPERSRCQQCHVPTVTRAEFSTAFGPGS
jgi:cytochrome c-type protein NapB